VIHKTVTREVARKMTAAEWDTAALKEARERCAIADLEKEIRDFSSAPRTDADGNELPSRKDEIAALKKSSGKLAREVVAKAHLVETECIEAHDLNRNTVTVYVALPGGEKGEAIEERAMTDEERKIAESSAPFASGPIDVPDGERVTVDDDEPAS
jgi:hypothetical protein